MQRCSPEFQLSVNSLLVSLQLASHADALSSSHNDSSPSLHDELRASAQEASLQLVGSRNQLARLECNSEPEHVRQGNISIHLFAI